MGGVHVTALAIADAQGAGDGARLFHE